MMDAEDAARRWRETWLHAWPTRDVEAVRSLYGSDAVFRSHPFREPHRGAAGAAAYGEWAFAEEEAAAECRFGEPVVAGDRAACEYWAVVRSAGGEQTIAGVAVIRFGRDGLVTAQRDYWAIEPGRREPPEGWGE